MDKEWQRRIKIAAGMPNVADFVALLEARIDMVADVRVKLPQELASVTTDEQRRAAVTILTDLVDTLRRSGDNRGRKEASGDDSV